MSTLEARLSALALETPWFLRVLKAARALELASWCIGAGAVRNLVWDALHGFDTPSQLADIDVAYFEPSDCSGGHDEALRRRLRMTAPDLPWEVSNQACVHHWYEDRYHIAVVPHVSLDDALASWPEFATAVGIWLTPAGACRVIAPYGLDDLFGMIIRHNPARVSDAVYRQRIDDKRYSERWPRVTIIGA